MATTHVFIVDRNTFNVHLQYMFAGTGYTKKEYEKVNGKNKAKKFNHKQEIDLNKYLNNKEKHSIGMLADLSRIRVGDKIFFYVTQDLDTNEPGRFYGIFKAKSELFFDKNTRIIEQKVTEKLKKYLSNRIKIEPYEVYENGVEEWEALDNFTIVSNNNKLPLLLNMQMSLIYRKLKGHRGCTMISEHESNNLTQLLKSNCNKKINYTSFAFCEETNKIKKSDFNNFVPAPSLKKIDLLPKINELNKQPNKAFEAQLQMYILQHINRNVEHQYFNPTLNDVIFEKDIRPTKLWIGNEVSCGFGMRSIDILLLADINNSKEIFILELKSRRAEAKDLSQIEKYIKWIELYLVPTISGNIKIKPIIITLAEKEYKNQKKYRGNYIKFLNELTSVNSKIQTNNKTLSILPVSHIQFECKNDTLAFS